MSVGCVQDFRGCVQDLAGLPSTGLLLRRTAQNFALFPPLSRFHSFFLSCGWAHGLSCETPVAFEMSRTIVLASSQKTSNTTEIPRDDAPLPPSGPTHLLALTFSGLFFVLFVLLLILLLMRTAALFQCKFAPTPHSNPCANCAWPTASRKRPHWLAIFSTRNEMGHQSAKLSKKTFEFSPTPRSLCQPTFGTDPAEAQKTLEENPHSSRRPIRMASPSPLRVNESELLVEGGQT